jgi:serine/threonine protein kinase
MSVELTQNVIKSITGMRVKNASEIVSLHKYIFLLALINLYKQNSLRDNKFPLDAELEAAFNSEWHRFFPKNDQQENFVEYPFFHLVNDGFWHLQIKSEKQNVYDKYAKNKIRMTKKRLEETVEYGFLDIEFHKTFSEDTSRGPIISQLLCSLEGKQTSHELKRLHPGHKSSSLYAHEARAITQIESAIQSRSLGYVCSNIDIHDPQSNRFFEIDVLIACPFGLYVVELKHWTGNVIIRPYNWSVNGFSRTNPHKGNNFKAKLVRGLCERQYPYLRLPYVESVVTLTHPEVQTKGTAHPGTDKNQPTFGSIDGLIDYLKNQKDIRQSLLSYEEVPKIRDYIESLHKPGRSHDIQFPGYEIVERFYQTEERVELIARRTDVRHRRLTRLRVFFDTARYSDSEANAFVERAKATLNAVADVGDHPNILRVWSVPNEDGHLIEGSDWSEQGTLRDTIFQKAPIELSLTLTITRGILAGLAAIHAEGVIHRNLSPENILFVGDTPKLMNFDLSYQLADDRTTVIPDPTKLKRQAYIAPEIYRNDSFADDADLFSVGVLMYQMLTGDRPFKCSMDLKDSNGKLHQHCSEKLSKMGIPDELIILINDLVQLDRTLRPASATSVLERLNEYAIERIPGPNAQLQQGDEHEQYIIVEFLRKGSESQTYKARGPLGEVLFLKLFNIDVSQERIIREKKLSAAVTHGSIVKAEYCQRWSNQRWLLAFEWIEGRTIYEHKGEEPPEIEFFIKVTQTLLKALEVLHTFEEDGTTNPILHNDIKPDNIVITPDGRPKLIDFGIASHPNTSLFAGTNGYVPPDTLSGEDREYSIQGDLFGLGVTLFEWFFGCRPYDTLTVGAKPVDMQVLRSEITPELQQWFLRAVASQSEERFDSAVEMEAVLREAVSPMNEVAESECNIITDRKLIDWSSEDEIKSPAGSTQHEPEIVTFSPSPGATPNPFVAYLNTLNNIDASSGNALAENQACNPWFGVIQVRHPLTDRIKAELLDKKRHVILTGHAGDGKSTIGLELFKELSSIPAHEPLKDELKRIEKVVINGQSLILVKDFSEWDDESRISIIKDVAVANAPTMLLISNTGTLLDVFCKIYKRDDRDWLGAESNLLDSFAKSTPTLVEHNGVEYLVINLAMFDNLSIARSIINRMLCKERWEFCNTCTEQNKCPVRRNVSLLQENPAALERIFLLYRRMFEYGDRFTLRQLVAHMAYLVTAGMEYSDIVEYANRPEPPLLSEFMFFNRFFGDNGRVPDKPSQQMHVVRTACSQELGERPCPSWERRLWLREGQSDFKFNAKGNISDFNRLRQIGAGQKDTVFYKGQQGQHLARKQIRRMLFFLHDFPEGTSGEKEEKRIYLSTFLRTPMLLELLEWREQTKRLSPNQKADLLYKVLHVLQEHFTGIRIPEGTSFDNNLYVTLSRNARDIRQSAQVVLADFRAKDFKIAFELGTDGSNSTRPLYFEGVGQYESAKLVLELPFLDYVMMRHNGETGQPLQTAFSDRLDRFKTEIVTLSKTDEEDQTVMLLRLQTNRTFREQKLFVGDEKLEVTRNA